MQIITQMDTVVRTVTQEENTCTGMLFLKERLTYLGILDVLVEIYQYSEYIICTFYIHSLQEVLVKL